VAESNGRAGELKIRNGEAGEPKIRNGKVIHELKIRNGIIS
jgi:hypothetical protein